MRCLLLALIGYSCTPKIVHFTNDDADFVSYGTYAIVNYKMGTQEIPSEQRDAMTNIEQAANHEMSRRGYETDNVSPDLLLRYELITNQKTNSSVNVNPYTNLPTPVIRSVLESILLFELSDTQTKKMVWQASIDLSQYAAKKTNDDSILSSVVYLFDTFLHQAHSQEQDLNLKTHK